MADIIEVTYAPSPPATLREMLRAERSRQLMAHPHGDWDVADVLPIVAQWILQQADAAENPGEEALMRLVAEVVLW